MTLPPKVNYMSSSYLVKLGTSVITNIPSKVRLNLLQQLWKLGTNAIPLETVTTS